jgi:hypothetical protein
MYTCVNDTITCVHLRTITCECYDIRDCTMHAPHFSHGNAGMDRHHALSRVDSGLGDTCLRHRGRTNSRPGTNFLDSSSATPLSTPGRCETIDGAYRLSAMSKASSRAMVLIDPDLALSFDAIVNAATLSELTAMTARSLRQWSCHCRRLTRRASASRTCWSSDPRPVNGICRVLTAASETSV